MTILDRQFSTQNLRYVTVCALQQVASMQRAELREEGKSAQYMTQTQSGFCSLLVFGKGCNSLCASCLIYQLQMTPLYMCRVTAVSVV